VLGIPINTGRDELLILSPPFPVNRKGMFKSLLPHIRKDMKPEQDCLQCGKCCERWGWGQKGVVEDLVPWLEEGRRDILQHVSIRLSDGRWVSGTAITAGDLLRVSQVRYWQDRDGTTIRKCPFFTRSGEGKARCRIHDVKPAVCRAFAPWNWENNEFYGNCPACREKTP
jgi:Fe-S-cluster containining protein